MKTTKIWAWHWAILSAVGVCAACAWGISCIGEPSVNLDTTMGGKPISDAGGDAMVDGPAKQCTPENSATQCDDENPCTVDACDDKGTCRHTPNASAVPPDSGNPCQPYTCSQEGELVQETLADGTPCGMGMNGVLICRQGACISGCLNDGNCGALMEGYCFDFSCIGCKDNIRNGDETDVDCGGHCKKCQGDPCTDSATCKTNKCVDGVCCNADCNQECRACNVEGHVGECVNTPQYQTDLYPNNAACTGSQQCDGMGHCKASIDTACLGDATKCASGFCWTSPSTDICKLGLNKPCTVAEQSDCFTGYCNPIALECQTAPSGFPCVFNEQCASNSCNGGNKCN